jgi:hypothetical protein
MKFSWFLFTCWTSICMATSYEVKGRGSIPARGRVFLLYSVQSGSGAHPVSYLMGTMGNFPGDIAACA